MWGTKGCHPREREDPLALAHARGQSAKIAALRTANIRNLAGNKRSCPLTKSGVSWVLASARMTFFCFLIFSTHAFSNIPPDQILSAVKYPGCQMEKKLNDLLRADYHEALALYYQNREQAGFMALERFELALQRGIGDIRELSFIKELDRRQQKSLEVAKNWQAAFKRAREKSLPNE
jgi:hypothetical protein